MTYNGVESQIEKTDLMAKEDFLKFIEEEKANSLIATIDKRNATYKYRAAKSSSTPDSNRC